MDFKGYVSNEVITLKFAQAGQVESINFDIGKEIKKGQLLSRLRQVELQAYLDRALRFYEQVRAEFDEKSKTNLSEYDRRKLNAELDVSVKNVEIAKENLESTNLYSPLNGVVIDAESVLVGQNITPASFTISVIDPNKFEFCLDIKEDELKLLSVGTEGKLVLNIDQEKSISAKVVRIGLKANKDGLFPVWVSLSGQTDLRIGLSGTFKVETNEKEVS